MTYLFEAITPTRIYRKQCSHCGLNYLGKTIKEDIENYPGSGEHWKNHLKKHKAKAIHVWNSDWFYDTSIVDYALSLSEKLNIVESKKWANKRLENGLDGALPGEGNGMFGKTHSEESRKKMSEKTARENHPFYGMKRPDFAEKISGENHHKPWLGKKNPEHSERLKGWVFTKEHREKLSSASKGENNPMFGVKRPKTACKYCNKMVDAANMARYHNEKCKMKDNK